MARLAAEAYCDLERERRMNRVSFVGSIALCLLLAVVFLIDGTAMPARSQPCSESGAINEPITAGGAEPRYLLFWRSPERASDLIKTG